MSMILFDTLSLTQLPTSGAEYRFSISLNESARVFKGHFPEQPVLPGVIMVAAVKSAMEAITNTKLVLYSSTAIKFLEAIVPGLQPNLELAVSYQRLEDGHMADAKIVSGEKSLFKIKAQYKPV